MKKRIVLLRHGKPQLCGRESRCIGKGTDPPLSEEGVRQARRLTEYFAGRNRIYCSPLLRSRQTAQIVGGEDCTTVRIPDVTEMDMGEWEGLTFSEIRGRFPKSYAQRGMDWSTPMPGGETLVEAADRMQAAAERLAKAEEEDVVIVTHDGAIRALLWRIMQLDTTADMIRVPYGSITVLGYDGERLTVGAVGKLPGEAPSDEEITELWEEADMPDHIRAHCRAVSRECEKIQESLASAGHLLPQEELRAAALLHDLCRQSGRGHEKAAAEILRQRGYFGAARMVELHGDGSDGPLDEAQILFYADKLYRGAVKVDMEERFRRSEEKCLGETAKKMHDMRLLRARNIGSEIEERCGCIMRRQTGRNSYETDADTGCRGADSLP